MTSRTESPPGKGAWPALACLLLAVLPACTQLLGGAPEMQHKRRFTIVSAPIHQDLPGSERPYPVTVQVRPFNIAGAYNQTEIVTRRSPYEMMRDRNSVWAQRPREMIMDVVMEYLRGARLFARLAAPDELLNDRPDYVLGGSIEALERYDSGDRWFARLALSMQLVRQQDGVVVWRGVVPADLKVEVYNPGMEHTVEALSEILRRSMEEFVHQMDLVMRGAPPTEATVAADGAPADSLRQAGADTARALALPSYYEFIPGKIAPE